MSFIKEVFDTFSGRPGPSGSTLPDVPYSTKQRVFLWWTDLLVYRGSADGTNVYLLEAWRELRRSLVIRHRRTNLTGREFRYSENPERADTVAFIFGGSTENFLDFLEDLFRCSQLLFIYVSKREIVEELNELLELDKCPYFVTEYSEAHEEVEGAPSPLPGKGRTVHITYPKVVLRDADIVHQSVIEPTLKLLQAPIFVSANDEFLKALEDYRKQDYPDCLTMCGSAFESVLKIIASNKHWAYRQTDTAKSLIELYVKEMNLAMEFKEAMLIVPKLRNKESSSHGKGVVSKDVSRDVARFMINQTASWMLFCTERAGLG